MGTYLRLVEEAVKQNIMCNTRYAASLHQALTHTNPPCPSACFLCAPHSHQTTSSCCCVWLCSADMKWDKLRQQPAPYSPEGAPTSLPLLVPLQCPSSAACCIEHMPKYLRITSRAQDSQDTTPSVSSAPPALPFFKPPPTHTFSPSLISPAHLMPHLTHLWLADA